MLIVVFTIIPAPRRRQVAHNMIDIIIRGLPDWAKTDGGTTQVRSSIGRSKMPLMPLYHVVPEDMADKMMIKAEEGEVIMN
jgi:hypothetical protein